MCNNSGEGENICQRLVRGWGRVIWEVTKGSDLRVILNRVLQNLVAKLNF